MKKLLILFVFLFISNVVMGFNPYVFKGAGNTTTTTTGNLYTVEYDGYMHIFAHSKIYVDLDPSGVTANANDLYINAGSSIRTDLYYFKGDKIGLMSDSGTPSVNFTTYDYLRRVN